MDNLFNLENRAITSHIISEKDDQIKKVFIINGALVFPILKKFQVKSIILLLNFVL